MTTQVPAQPALNGFEALPKNERQWFLIRVQSLSRAPENKGLDLNRQSIA
jgi:hypothetical protein